MVLENKKNVDVDFEPPSAATNVCRRKRGRLQESSSETRLLSETAATISTVSLPETAILVAGICVCSSESEVCRKCLKGYAM
nr:hypothetical protein [Tanacetum cinerariifolium]